MFLTKDNIDLRKEALVDDNGTIVLYGDLLSDCNKLGKNIKGRHLILILADKKIETIRFYYACMANRNVVLLLNPDSESEYIKKYITTYHPQYIYLPNTLEMDFDVEKEVYRGEKNVLYKTTYSSVQLYDELALLLTTSGSTGNPKTVRLSYTNLHDNVMAFIDAIDLIQEDRGLLTLPIYYTYGLAILHMHFFAGATILVSEKKLFDPLLETFMIRENVTNWHGVPYVYETFRRVGLLDRIPKSLRLLTMGGGKANADLYEYINRIYYKCGVRVYAMYGQTEGTTILTKVPDEEYLNPPGCIGVACKGMEAFTDFETGELCFKGSSVCLGYAMDYRDLEKTDENKGFLRTGDLAEIKANGQIVLTGRIKRIAKLRGIRINLEDVEKDIERLFHIPAVCIDYNGTLHTFIENDSEKDAILNWLSKQYKVSRRLLLVEKIEKFPHSSVGKIDYGVLTNLCNCNHSC